MSPSCRLFLLFVGIALRWVLLCLTGSNKFLFLFLFPLFHVSAILQCSRTVERNPTTGQAQVPRVCTDGTRAFIVKRNTVYAFPFLFLCRRRRVVVRDGPKSGSFQLFSIVNLPSCVSGEPRDVIDEKLQK